MNARAIGLTGLAGVGLLAADMAYLVWPNQRKHDAIVAAIAWGESCIQDAADVIEQIEESL